MERVQLMLESLGQAIGPLYGSVLLLAGLSVVICILLLVRKRRTSDMARACKASIPIPFFIGLFGSLHGMLSVLHQLARNNTPIRAEESYTILFTVLSTTFVGFLFSLIAYVIFVVGTLYWGDRGGIQTDD